MLNPTYSRLMTHSELQHHMFTNYITLRISLALLAFGFPILLCLGGFLVNVPPQASMSEYYPFSNVAGWSLRDLFVGMLFSIGILLYVHRGYSYRENYALNLAGIFAIVSANRRKLSKAELALYRINHQKLASKMAKAMGFTEQLEQINGQAALWKVGVFNPQAEHRFPVYCFLGQTSSQLENTINQLGMTQDGPFVLIAAVSRLISHASSEASNQHKSKLIGIDDVLGVDAGGKVQAQDRAHTIIGTWLKTVLPKSARPGSEYHFPTPAGATWAQVAVEFTATEMLLVTCGQVQARLEPEHLKMKNQHSGPANAAVDVVAVLSRNGWEPLVAGC